MKTINWYIIKQLLLGFVLMAVGMTALIWLSQSLRFIDWIINKGVSVSLFIELTLLVLPNFIAVITPLAFFIVLMFVYQRLLADRELIVMKAAGMSAWDLAKPALIMGLGLTVLGYFLTLWLVPYSVSQYKELQFKIRNNLAQVVIQEGEFNQLANNITAYVRVFKPSGEIDGILIHDDRDLEKRVVMVAEQGLYLMGENGARIVMQQGTRQEYNRKTGTFSSLSFEQNVLTFEESKNNQVRTLGEQELSLKRLLTAKADEPNLRPADYREYKVEAYKRLTQPLYALVFLFVALVPLLLGHYNRRGQSERVYLAVGCVVLLQSMALGFENLANKNLWFLILMTLNFLLPIVFGAIILKRGYFVKKLPKKLMFLERFFVILFALFVAFSASTAAAAPQFIADTNVDKDAPVDFEADTVSYNEKTSVITALGNVVVDQNGTKLTADKLTYNQKTQKGEAVGNVVITRPDGVQLKSNNAKLSDAFDEAELDNITMLFADGSTFKARSVVRTDKGNLSEFKNVFFTPCPYCEGKDPLWNVEASTVEHNYKEQEYTFYNAFLDLKGMPVFYWPYLTYPDFQVKRKTGFLAPGLAHSSEMGFGIETPFFWAISDSQDLFLTPIIADKHFPLVQGEYRGIYNKSKLVADFSFTQNDDDDNKEGHVKLNYEADLTERLRFTGQYYRVSNDTYFRRYPINNIDDQEPWIESFGKMEYFGNQSYAYANVMDFQNQRSYVQNDSMPLVSNVNYRFVSKPLWSGLYGVSTLNGADVYRKTHARSSRLSYQQELVLPYISPLGFVFENQVTGRFDGYAVRDENKQSDNLSRAYVNASSKVSYPMILAGKNYSQIIEPIAMLVVSPNSKSKNKIPNEDSIDLTFDDVNLFVANRFNGYDKVETGSRANYGVQWSLFGPDNIFLSAVFGQSYQFRADGKNETVATYDDHFSSYVGHLNMDFKDFGVNYRFRLNQKNFSHEMSETQFYVGRDPLRLTVAYLYLQATKELITKKGAIDREEVYLHLSSKLTQSLSTYGYYRYDLATGGGPTEAGGGLQYDNECLTLLFTVQKEFTKDKDYKGDTSFLMRVILKTLGGV